MKFKALWVAEDGRSVAAVTFAASPTRTTRTASPPTLET